MTVPLWILLLSTFVELMLLFFVLVFFARLKRSEQLLSQLQQKQESLLAKLHFNNELEQELVASFQERQAELAALDQQLVAKAEELKKLIRQAEVLAKDPRAMKRAVVEGRRKGHTPQELARATGLSLDEVELILFESGK